MTDPVRTPPSPAPSASPALGRTYAEARRSWWPGWIWAVPIAALLVVGWLGFRALAQGGKTVTVTFDQAPGVRKIDTKVVYRGITVGQVADLRLAPDGRSVVVKLSIDKQAEPFLRAGSRFWLIGAHPSLQRLSELKDAITGPQIGLEPGGGAAAQTFHGLDEPPEDAPIGPQVAYRVRFDGPAGSLQAGAPVSLQGFRVGRVTGAALSYDAGAGALTATVNLALEPQRMGLAASGGPDGRAASDAMLDRLIHRGLRAELAQSPPLIGPRQVDLAFTAPAGTSGLQIEGQDRVIPAAAGPDLTALEAKADEILGKVDAVPIEQIGDNIRAATQRLRVLLQSPAIDHTLNQVDDATANLDKTIRAVSPQVGPLVRKLRQTADDADDTVDAARKVIGGDPTSQDSDVPSALHQITSAARALRELADELERRPESLLKGRPEGGAMSPLCRPIPLLLAAALLSGCGHSPPSRFFTLDPTPPSQPVSAVATLAPVQLDAVHIPADLDRAELVTQTGPGRLTISGQDRWGAPLGEMMRRVLAQDLASRLPQGAFVFPDAPHPAGTRGLVVTVLQLTAAPNGRVNLQANWSLLDDGSSKAVKSGDLALSANATSDNQAQAVSAVLGQAADRIASALLRG